MTQRIQLFIKYIFQHFLKKKTIYLKQKHMLNVSILTVIVMRARLLWRQLQSALEPHFGLSGATAL